MPRLLGDVYSLLGGGKGALALALQLPEEGVGGLCLACQNWQRKTHLIHSFTSPFSLRDIGYSTTGSGYLWPLAGFCSSDSHTSFRTIRISSLNLSSDGHRYFLGNSTPAT